LWQQTRLITDFKAEKSSLAATNKTDKREEKLWSEKESRRVE
jgi:hypothetical protein